MIRVDPHVVPTRLQRFGSCIEVVEYHGEVATVSTCRFKPNADAPQRSYGHDRQLSEPNQR